LHFLSLDLDDDYAAGAMTAQSWLKGDCGETCGADAPPEAVPGPVGGADPQPQRIAAPAVSTTKKNLCMTWSFMEMAIRTARSTLDRGRPARIAVRWRLPTPIRMGLPAERTRSRRARQRR
jgi:hypothetical protein